MVNCYVVGCDTGIKRKVSYHAFKIPKKASEETKAQWRRNIPKQKNRDFSFTKDRICSLHFEEKYIVKTNRVMGPSGEIMAEEDRKHWTIKDNAVPTIFNNPELPLYFNKPGCKRQSPKKRDFGKNISLLNKPIEGDTDTGANYYLAEKVLDNSTLELDLSQFLLDTPTFWVRRTFAGAVEYCKIVQLTSIPVKTFQAERSIELSTNGNVVVMIRHKIVTDQFEHQIIRTKQQLESLIEAVENVSICPGNSNFGLVKSHRGAYKCGNSWVSNDCAMLLQPNELKCKNCMILNTELALSVRKLMNPPKKRPCKIAKIMNQSEKEQASKFKKNTKEKISRLQNRNRLLKAENFSMRKKFQKTDMTHLKDFLTKYDHLSENFKMAILTAAQYQKLKGKSGMRYSGDWLLQCLLLKVTSPKAYRHLRDEEILPLPHPSTLTRLLRGLKCQFGFNQFIFNHLNNEFKNTQRRDRQVFIVFDEMKVKEAISFDKSVMQFTGFIDYAEFSNEVGSRKPGKPEADHALVFMVRALNSKLTQPIAAFATNGAAPGNVLAKMILSCILKLEDANLQVAGVVCDGASTNKTAWKILGITGAASTIVNKIQNPADENRHVHFLCDIPHIMKCIRNNFQKLKVCQFRGEMINWDFFRALYDEDCKHEVRAAPKLTNRHIHPGPFQKMSVALAVQIFSKRVADALRFYREISNVFFKYSESTESFVRTMNALFDACNARIPSEGLRPNSPGYKIILDFLSNLDSRDTFSSDLTMASLRVTLRSILDLVDYLCNEVGYCYVLTAKFNQDCLEKFFGLVRSYGGDNAHPCLTSFGHLYRLLAIFNPTKRVIKGNVQTDEETGVSVVSYLDSLKSMRLSRDEEINELKRRLGNEILEKMFYSQKPWNSIELLQIDHAYSKPNGLACIVFQLCGYIVHRGKVFTDCKQCLLLLEDKDYKPPEAQLTLIKDLGGLKYPSKALHVLLSSEVEPILNNLDPSVLASKDLAHQIVSKLGSLHTKGIGCSQDHSEELTVHIVLYYIAIRMYFHAKIHNREHLSSILKSKEKMKEGKLK